MGVSTMSWNEQTESLVKGFTDDQTNMWENCCDLLRSAPGPAMPFSPAMLDQWRELATQGLKGWTVDSEQVVKDVAERLHVAQDGVMRFLELSVRAWRAMAPKV